MPQLLDKLSSLQTTFSSSPQYSLESLLFSLTQSAYSTSNAFPQKPPHLQLSLSYPDSIPEVLYSFENLRRFLTLFKVFKGEDCSKVAKRVKKNLAFARVTEVEVLIQKMVIERVFGQEGMRTEEKVEVLENMKIIDLAKYLDVFD